MKFVGDSLVLSASDLSIFLGCRHRTALDLAVARGELDRPTWVDPFADILRARGQEHERRYVESLRATGLTIVDLAGQADADEQTILAMREGVDAIVQACLRNGRWLGYADILQRIETPSDLGGWSYEVYDTKLARATKAGTILQLAVYSDLLADVQGPHPEHFHVVTPDLANPLQRYRLADYEAYYRLVRRQIAEHASVSPQQLLTATYPEPVEHCEVCRWFLHCERRRRTDDHLSYVAGISRVHRRELQSRDIVTLTQLAEMKVPLTFKPSRGARATYERLQDQARLQALSRATKQPAFEPLLPPDPGQGLSRLPEPSPEDVFLDIEGYPFAREGGREYLFGIAGAAGAPSAAGAAGALPLLALAKAADQPFHYTARWAFDDGQERAAFEAVVDLILERWVTDPGMHVYHFGHYEPSALKRLMGRYASREEAIDKLLRSERFVDLHMVLRHAIRAGVESYSIKQLERFYDFTRAVALAEAAISRRTFELALENDVIGAVGDAVKDVVELYNRDDCRSTLALRDWLESVRTTIIGAGHPITRPTPKPSDAPEKVSDIQARVEDLRTRLLEGVPADVQARTDDQQTRWLLAYLLDWHRREDKVAWWEYYRLRDLPEDELYDEPQAVAGLMFVEHVGEVLNKKTGRPTGTVIHRYSFPPQEMEIREGDELKSTDGKKFADVDAVDRDARTIDILKGKNVAETHPTALFEHRYFPPDTMQKALLRLAERVVYKAETSSAGLDLLFRRTPRLVKGAFSQGADESVLEFAVRCGLDLDASTFAIQGPPGSGKTFTGARMICALVASGKRVGVTAVSHKVIRKLLDDVRLEAAKRGQSMRCGHKTRPRDDDPAEMIVVDDNKEGLALLCNKQLDVLGGTAWLWGREEAADSTDVLFVDEAGQMSLANVLAASQAAKSVVLLGDPQQLEQPQKGSHPDGVDISALEHVLRAAKTMPSDHGLFLPITWRLAPAICKFTSETFYESRLAPKTGLERQLLRHAGSFDGAGLWWVPVEHDRNHNWSAEEIDVVDRVVSMLLAEGRWVDEHCIERPLTGEDVLVVAPYNAQVNRIRERFAGVAGVAGVVGFAGLKSRATYGATYAESVRVGTVDKFQGQEAPVVIYSMTSSSPQDAPRGMEFLYSLNRLNVATSRARCAVVLVASPSLFEPECRTPRQMQLANALCRYREMAQVLTSDAIEAARP